MALSTSSARARVKDLLDIPTATTTFDSDIDAYVLSAVDQLFPQALNEMAPDTSVTLAADAQDAALPTDTVAVAKLEVYTSGLGYQPTSDYSVYAGRVYLTNPVDVSTQLRIWGLKRYILTTVPAELELVVFYWSAAQFYLSLAGNRRKYNAYLATGATADRDVKDSADLYQSMGDRIFDDKTTARAG